MTENLLQFSTPALLNAEQMNRALVAYQANVNPQFTDLIDAYGRDWPSMSPELGFTLASQGLDPMSEEVIGIAQAEGLELIQQTQDNHGLLGGVAKWTGEAVQGISEAVTDTARWATRTGFTLAEGIYQEVVARPLRALAGAASQASGQWSPDGNNSIMDDALDSVGILLSPKFYMGNEGLFRNFGEQHARAGSSDLVATGKRLASGELSAGQVFSPWHTDGRQGMTNDDGSTLGATDGTQQEALGSGWIPSGDTGQQAARDREQIQIGGAGAGFGDLIMTGVGSVSKDDWGAPGSEAHERWSGILQLGFDIGADPLGAAMSVTSKVGKVAKGVGMTDQVIAGGGKFSPVPRMVLGHKPRNVNELSEGYRMGLVHGGTSTNVQEKVVANYVQSKEFLPVVEKIKEFANSPTGLIDLDKALKGKLRVGEQNELLKLARAGDDIALQSKVADLIGSSLRSKVELRKVRRTSRWASYLPEEGIDLELGASHAARQVDRALISAKVDDVTRAEFRTKWAEGVFDGVEGVFHNDNIQGFAATTTAREIVQDAYKAIGSKLTQKWEAQGMSPEAARKQLKDSGWDKVFPDLDDDRVFIGDSLSKDTGLMNNMAEITGIDALKDVTPKFEVDQLKNIPLPNTREIAKELTGGAMNSKMFKSAYEMELAVSDFIMQAWVPAKLLRGAWTVRVVGEEMVRMTAAGYDTVFNHPFSALSWILGNKGLVLDEVRTGQSATKFTDDAFAKQTLNDAMTRDINLTGRAPQVGGTQRVATGGHRLAKRPVEGVRPDPGYTVGHRTAVGKLHREELTRELARSRRGGEKSTQDIKDWFYENKFNDWLTSLGPKAAKEVLEGGNARAVSDAYVAFSDRLLVQMTGGKDDMLEFVGTGRFTPDAEDLAKADDDFPTGFHLNDMAHDQRAIDTLDRKLRKMHKEGLGPDAVPTPRMTDAERASGYDKALRKMFHVFMAVPSNKLSRNPTFRQAYWQRMTELGRQMSDDVRDEIFETVKAEGIFKPDSNEFKALQRELKVHSRHSSPAFTSMESVERAVKAHAMQVTQDLLYDQARRGQWTDMARGLFVFAEAWREIATTWAKLATANPNIARRAEQGTTGMRDAGIFYTDEQTGQEKFAYPGGSWISSLIGLGDTKLTGTVEGLNMLSTSVVPGLGPVVQLAASKVLPDGSDWDWMREMFMPFGEPDVETPGGFIDEALPPFVKKFMQGMVPGKIDEGQFANTQMDVIRSLMMQDPDKYQGVEGLRQLEIDARHKARLAFMYRGFAQFFSPTAPAIEFYGQTETSEQFTFVALAEEYRNLQDKTGSDAEATRMFEQKFGLDPTYIRQGKTTGLQERSFNPEGANWERDNKDLVEKYADVIGYFSPDDGTGEFDFTAFTRAKKEGARQQLKPAEFITLANKRKGQIAYERATEILEDGGVKGAQLTNAKRDIRMALTEEYPGFGQDIARLGKRITVDKQIVQIREALTEERISSTPVGEATAIYLKAHDQLLAIANERGFTTLSGKKVEDLRRALLAVGTDLSGRYDGFGMMWDRVFAREIKADQLEVAA